MEDRTERIGKNEAIYRVFNQYEIAGYVASRKPAARKTLKQLLLTD